MINIVYCYLFIYHNWQHKSHIFMILHSVVQTVFIWPVISSFLLAIKLTIMFNIEYCQQCSIVYLILLSYSFVYVIVLFISYYCLSYSFVYLIVLIVFHLIVLSILEYHLSRQSQYYLAMHARKMDQKVAAIKRLTLSYIICYYRESWWTFRYWMSVHFLHPPTLPPSY